MSETYLIHHGIKGQKWGVRRFQNEDGSLTPLGRKKLLKKDGTLNRKGIKIATNSYLKKMRDYKNSEEYDQALSKANTKALAEARKKADAANDGDFDLYYEEAFSKQNTKILNEVARQVVDKSPLTSQQAAEQARKLSIKSDKFRRQSEAGSKMVDASILLTGLSVAFTGMTTHSSGMPALAACIGLSATALAAGYTVSKDRKSRKLYQDANSLHKLDYYK